MRQARDDPESTIPILFIKVLGLLAGPLPEMTPLLPRVACTATGVVARARMNRCMDLDTFHVQEKKA